MFVDTDALIQQYFDNLSVLILHILIAKEEQKAQDHISVSELQSGLLLMQYGGMTF